MNQTIDFHLIHYNEPHHWINGHVNHIESHGHCCHVMTGFKDGIKEQRIKGFQTGSNDFVSFVDPDDCVDLTQLPTQLDGRANYTNSYVQRNNQYSALYKNKKWTWERHKQLGLPVHQLIIVEREIVDKAIISMIKTDIFAQSTFFIEPLLYSYIAMYTPWRFYNCFPYTWNQQDSYNKSHRRSTDQQKQIIREHAKSLTPLWL